MTTKDTILSEFERLWRTALASMEGIDQLDEVLYRNFFLSGWLACEHYKENKP